ncbi:MAG: pyridoxamine 5'-phosphate oxidase family protein [Oscillospiraceae bacterium]|nr:pyridoxamine 5'-phosphate oxidase family protein [Oscillospiraceae bacterium]MBQ7088168.1 pyridoxamine 5'-phosphate oxidase family protein [Clostridia bacterium]
MRRKDRERDREFGLAVIDSCEYGTVALQGDEPYCLPLSLVRVGEDLYFHCALEGKKMDLLRGNNKVWVSFVGENVAAADDFTTYFRSAMVRGTATEVADEGEKIAALRALCEKLTPAHMPAFDAAIARSLKVTGIWKIHMDEITAKEKQRPVK